MNSFRSFVSAPSKRRRTSVVVTIFVVVVILFCSKEEMWMSTDFEAWIFII